MTSIIEKRRNIHLELQEQKAKNRQLRKELDRAVSLAGMGAAAAIIAHEINNLLTPIGNYAALALKYPEDRKLIEKALKQTYENCRHASGVVSAILSVASGQKQQKEKVNLAKLVDEVFRCICRDFSKDNIRTDINISPDLTINAVPSNIQQVLMNLIINARDSMLGKGGILSIRASKNENIITIEVKDSGSGIKKEYLTSIFEPFFSTKDKTAKSGSGLGLYLCKKVVDEHEGTISVESQPQVGTTFIITLPDESAETV